MNTLAPTRTPSVAATASTISIRTGLQIARSPQILVIAIAQSVVFVLMFRYVLGGAIGVEGIDYVDFLIPGFVVCGMVFTAAGGAVAVATDAASGVYDRYRSLPVIDIAVLLGRAIADAALIVLVALVTLALGLAIGFRPGGTALGFITSVGLVAVFAMAIAVVFIWVGLASGGAQAAQGLAILGVPFSFLSSAFVPVDSMPAVLRVIAEYQPLTFMIDAVRGLMLGDAVTDTFNHSLTYSVVGSLLWSAALLIVFTPLAVRTYRRSGN